MDNRRKYPFQDFLSWIEESRTVAGRRELLLSLAARVPDMLDCIRSYETGAEDICAATAARGVDAYESAPLLWAWYRYQEYLYRKMHERLCRPGEQSKTRREVLEWRKEEADFENALPMACEYLDD